MAETTSPQAILEKFKKDTSLTFEVKKINDKTDVFEDVYGMQFELNTLQQYPLARGVFVTQTIKSKKYSIIIDYEDLPTKEIWEKYEPIQNIETAADVGLYLTSIFSKSPIGSLLDIYTRVQHHDEAIKKLYACLEAMASKLQEEN